MTEKNTVQTEPEAVRLMKELLSANGLQIKFRQGYPLRTYAWISETEVKQPRDSGMLISMLAYGKSEEEALRNLAQKISGGRLVHRAYTERRKEVDIPVLPRDNDIPPLENEIVFHPQGEIHEDFSCYECSEKMSPRQPRWKIRDTEYRICESCVQKRRIFMGELRPEGDSQ